MDQILALSDCVKGFTYHATLAIVVEYVFMPPLWGGAYRFALVRPCVCLRVCMLLVRNAFVCLKSIRDCHRTLEQCWLACEVAHLGFCFPRRPVTAVLGLDLKHLSKVFEVCALGVWLIIVSQFASFYHLLAFVTRLESWDIRALWTHFCFFCLCFFR